MNSKDEIVAVFDDKGGDAHPPAIFTQTGTVGQMDACGAEWPDANFDADKMALLAVQPHEMFGFATARVPFSIAVDADAFGCRIDRGARDRQPSVRGSPFLQDGELVDVPDDLITPDEFVSSEPVQTVLDAARKVARREELFVVGGTNGPMACVNNLIGMDNALMGLMMEPERVFAWLSAVTPHMEAYARAMSEACDDVMIIEEAAAEIVPPEMFDDVFVPYFPKVIKAARTSSFCTTHTCGDSLEVADRLSSLGMDGISLETSSDPEKYLKKIGGRTLSLGSVNPVGTLLQKSPEDVRAEARRCADLGFDIVTPECGVPPQTRNENLHALAHYRERSN